MTQGLALTRNPEWNVDARFDVLPTNTLQIKFLDERKKCAEIGFTIVQLEEFRQTRSELRLNVLPKGTVVLTGQLGVDRANPVGTSLPPGWERREDANGRIFYVDHNRHRTQWEPPIMEEGGRRQEEAELEAAVREEYARRSAAANVGTARSSSPCRVNQAVDEIDQAMRANFEGRTADEDEESRLPEGWSTGIAANGRIFFIDHNSRRTTWDDPRLSTASGGATLDHPLGPLPPGWEQRLSAIGEVFFVDHNRHITQWEDPRFAIAAKNSIETNATPYSPAFKKKVEYFRSKLPPPTSGQCSILINRNSIFEDSYRQIMRMQPEELRKKLWIELVGEQALDYGGVSREWCLLLSRSCLNPYYGLFQYSDSDTYTLQLNAHSEMCNPEHLDYFHFIGRVIGMAIYHGKLLDAFFVRPFYKMLLGQPLSLADMESVDSAIHNSLKYLQQNDSKDLGLTFSLDEDALGKMESVELKPGGADIVVTEENKAEYIETVVQWRIVKRTQKQMEALLLGLYELVPKTLLQLFDASDLELLMCGLQAIDVNDWRLNTVYEGYASNHPVIHNFWKCLFSMDNDKRAKLLQFVTGTSRVPMNGFAELYGSAGPLKFTIRLWNAEKALPRAHTCFNRLDLPPYKTYGEMRRKLLTAIDNSEVFGGVD